MGVDHNVYLGPYVLVVVDVDENGDNQPHGAVDAFDLDDVLINTNRGILPEIRHEEGGGGSYRYYYFVPNTRREGWPPQGMHLDETDHEVVPVWDRTPSVQVRWFQKAYASEVRQLFEVFGNLSFGWGLIRWAS